MVDQAKADLAASYKAMMDLGTWKHFKENILDRIEKISILDLDECPIEQFSIARLAHSRGRRDAIKQIKSDLEYILNGFQ